MAAGIPIQIGGGGGGGLSNMLAVLMARNSDRTRQKEAMMQRMFQSGPQFGQQFGRRQDSMMQMLLPLLMQQQQMGFQREQLQGVESRFGKGLEAAKEAREAGFTEAGRERTQQQTQFEALLGQQNIDRKMMLYPAQLKEARYQAERAYETEEALAGVAPKERRQETKIASAEQRVGGRLASVSAALASGLSERRDLKGLGKTYEMALRDFRPMINDLDSEDFMTRAIAESQLEQELPFLERAMEELDRSEFVPSAARYGPWAKARGRAPVKGILTRANVFIDDSPLPFKGGWRATANRELDAAAAKRNELLALLESARERLSSQAAEADLLRLLPMQEPDIRAAERKQKLAQRVQPYAGTLEEKLQQLQTTRGALFDLPLENQ